MTQIFLAIFFGQARHLADSYSSYLSLSEKVNTTWPELIGPASYDVTQHASHHTEREQHRDDQAQEDGEQRDG